MESTRRTWGYIEYLDIKTAQIDGCRLGKLGQMHKSNCLKKDRRPNVSIGSSNSNNDIEAYNAFGFHIDGACGAKQLNDVNRSSQNWVEF